MTTYFFPYRWCEDIFVTFLFKSPTPKSDFWARMQVYPSTLSIKPPTVFPRHARVYFVHQIVLLNPLSKLGIYESLQTCDVIDCFLWAWHNEQMSHLADDITGLRAQTYPQGTWEWSPLLWSGEGVQHLERDQEKWLVNVFRMCGAPCDFGAQRTCNSHDAECVLSDFGCQKEERMFRNLRTSNKTAVCRRVDVVKSWFLHASQNAQGVLGWMILSINQT